MNKLEAIDESQLEVICNQDASSKWLYSANEAMYYWLNQRTKKVFGKISLANIPDEITEQMPRAIKAMAAHKAAL